ncbi:MAG: TRAP transporter substrate-binding protein [Boseongicola sp. SB0664_bin_43]|uniref:TRAP transporter substrate-binding protein n=1 Tax=Boseongicola sp. SB0664_bin_43 TaxID=2604844 RepID=A0A6B0Y478_9RHOB|nr:TRAP transporter substrate-binding protein [Boseongicola sp. SB0664_bin_43]MYK32752.1 TRAP transporter substrate-binding protein [Boseongicola sp. SB0670_bin_30]
MKHMLIGTLTAASTLLAAPAVADTKLVVAGSEAVDSLLDRMAVKFDEILNAKAGELFDVNLIRGQSLGNATQVMEQHQAGSVDVMYSRPDWFTSNVQDFQVLSWGFTFRDREHMQTFLESDIFDGMNQQVVDKMGVRILSVAVDQPRILYTREPVSSVDDVQGMKMRVPGIKAYLKLWETIGTVPTQVAWAEAFLALKTGAVDGAEADASGAYSQKFHVAAPNITLTNHLMSSAHISVNEAKWNSLTAEQQQVLQAAATEAVNWMSETALGDSMATLDKMVAEGATVSEIDNGPFSEKARAGVTEMEAEGLWSSGLWQKIRDLEG